jgi:hypothetical protein
MVVERNEGFSQVCMWPGVVVTPEEAEEFVKYIQEQMGVRVQYLEQITTGPSFGDPTSGGRIDTVFAVHKDDTMKFALPRMSLGIRWIEDVLDNETRRGEERGRPSHSIYPEHLAEYRTW